MKEAISNTSEKTFVRSPGITGFVYQPKTTYTGKGIKWYPEEVKPEKSK